MCGFYALIYIWAIAKYGFCFHYYSTPPRCVWFNYPFRIGDAGPGAFQLYDKDVVEYSIPLEVIAKMQTVGRKWIILCNFKAES